MISNIANYNDYLNQLIESNKKLEMVVLYDLQDISHGRSLYDEYYENSWLYCDSVNHLINEQIINIQNGSNILYLKDNYNWLLKNCKSNYDKYQSSKLSILKMQANINKIEEI